MRHLTGTPTQLRSMLDAKELKEFNGIGTAAAFGVVTTAGIARTDALYSLAQTRWIAHPESHMAVPGPDYWEWKCLICGNAVDEHLTLKQYLSARLHQWRW